MANELKVTRTIVYENGSLKYTYQPGQVNLPQAAAGVHLQVLAATSTGQDVSVGTLTTPGKCVLYNLEPTTTGKTLNWGLKTSTGGIPYYFGLPPKDQAEIRYGTSAMVIRAQGAAAGAFKVLCVTFQA